MDERARSERELLGALDGERCPAGRRRGGETPALGWLRNNDETCLTKAGRPGESESPRVSRSPNFLEGVGHGKTEHVRT